MANAGVSEGRSFHKQRMEDFRRVVEINLMGTANVLHPVFRHMYRQGRGSIVVSTSVAGLYGEHGLPAYSASKAALLGLMYSLSQEGAAHGLRINALAPFAATPMTEANLPPALADHLHPGQRGAGAGMVDQRCLPTERRNHHRRRRQVHPGPGDGNRRPEGIPSGTRYDPDVLQSLWEDLEAQPLEQEPSRRAVEQFKNFIRDIVPAKELIMD